MRRRCVLIAATVWLAGWMSGLAAVRFVPSGGALNYPTIQAAITASSAGDTIRVQPGVYPETIVLRNFDLILTSMDPGDSNVVQNTVIQGDGTNSVVTFVAGQTTNTLFTGFTVRGGGGSTNFGNYLVGGGILCNQGSPSIIANIIESNNLPGSVFPVLGAGIGCVQASPKIARNVFRYNSAFAGGGIFTDSGKPRIQDNLFYNNTSENGGAVFISDQGVFLNNTLLANSPNQLFVDQSLLVANNIIADSGPGTGVIVSSVDPFTSWFQYNDVWEPGGAEIQILQQVGTNYILVSFSAAGTNGNLAVDPLFVDATNLDLRLTAASLCINAGDVLGLRSTNELDIAGASRVYALRVDMGANEFHGPKNFAPVANAGPDQLVYWSGVGALMVDGAASVDFNGDPLTFSWIQTAGPPVALFVTNSRAFFTPAGLAEYRFDLVVNDGVNDSPPDTVRVVVTNLPPIASAGLGQSLPVIPEVLVLDGSHSLDPEGSPLTYNWHQIGGPVGELTMPASARPVFRPAGPGAYQFELIVSDAFNSSPPDRVTFYLGQVPPIANAGPTRYAARVQVTLDGSASFIPNSSTPLQYSWRQLSGPTLFITPTNVVNPFVRGFVQTTAIREAVFELVVRADGLTSAPATVRVVIVPTWSNLAIAQVNGAFNTNRPTIIGFRGGDCDSGGSLSFPSTWLSTANVFTASYTRDPNSPLSAPRYYGYGEQMIVLLSLVAPDYDQPIQTMGISTGCMPALDVADRFNVRYKDPRYQVNRITFLDSACARDYNGDILNLSTNRMPGKMFWIDNYYSVAGAFRHPNTLNVQFPVPPADHGTPSTWYFPTWNIGTPYSSNIFNNGVYAGALFSLVGPGKNYQVETDKSDYHFGWNPTTSVVFPLNQLVQMAPVLNPARLPGVVVSTGPTNGALATPRKVTFTCLPVVNAVKYQILVGPDSRHVDRVAWEGPTPPTQPILQLPYPKTWWTIRVTDAYGTTSWADARFVNRDSDRDNLTDEAEVLTFHTDPDNADTDGDGHLDGQEVAVGTNPLQPEPGFSLACQVVSATQLRFSWNSDPGRSYDLEYSPTLTPATWQKLQTVVAPGSVRVQQTIAKPAGQLGYYRVRSY